MELKEYREELLQQTRLGAVANSNFRRWEFVNCVMDILTDSEEVSDFTECYFNGIIGSRNKRVEIDGYCYDEFDSTFTAVICKYDGHDAPGERLTKTEIEALAERARRFIEGSIDGSVQDSIDESEVAYELAEYIRSIHEEVERYQILVVSDLEKSDAIKTIRVGEVDGKEVTLQLWDISNLYNLEVSRRGYEDIEIDLSDFQSDGIPCIRACSSDNGEYEAYLCAIPGKLLAELYGRYGSRLLESNVRSFLKLQTKTNKAIRATILKEPEMFFAYNNGITTTATSINLEESEGSLVIHGFTALQIVNGGQTTVSLYTVGKSRDKPDISKIYVPMKINVVSREDAEDIVPKISRSANTQNKVSEADFFSNSQFNRIMEKLSRQELAPRKPGETYSTHWYYERTRGQYQQDMSVRSGSELKKFKLENPKSQKFTKTDLAKFRNSYDQKPNLVSKGAQDNLVNFSKTIDEEHLEKYNSSYFRDTIALAILFRRVEALVPEQPWYNGGYRAQIVTYTIAKLSDIIGKMGAALDLDRIWNEQALSPELEAQLIPIMKAVNDSLTEDKQEENIGQWCKKQACWDCVKRRTVEIDPDFKNCLISEKKANYQSKTATRNQRESNRMHARIDVVNLGPRFWEQAKSWGEEHEVLDWESRQLLDKAIDMERKLPTEREATRIMKVLDDLREAGYNR